MKILTNLRDALGMRRRVADVRFVVQSAFAFFIFYMGYRFYQFYEWAVGVSDHYVPRPPSVEGFLPISGLLGVKRLILTGEFDAIHPAGLTILLAAICIGLLLRKGFCGWICPVGYTSNLAEKIGMKMKIMFRMPVWIDLPLLSLKYILLAFFLYIIFWKMSLPAIISFQRSPYNMAADAKMLLFFISPSKLAGGITLFLVVCSFVIRNFWCRYLCPYGAFLGLLALASPFQVKRDKQKCIDCKKCEKICPGSIKLTNNQTMRHPECIGCSECVGICPVDECLEVSTPLKKSTHHLLLPVLVIGLFLAFYIVARVSGHWHTEIPLPQLQKFYQMSSHLPHPGVYGN